jgi:GNAT superfamily N-acetyltransferase
VTTGRYLQSAVAGHSIEIGKLTAADRQVWQELLTGYLEFYERTMPAEMYDRAWDAFVEDDRMHALGARLDGALVGITQFLIHPSTTRPDVCYLQDLFTAPAARGRGVATALITAVADWARERNCGAVYWRTQESNVSARRLYDQIADNTGFLVYQIAL